MTKAIIELQIDSLHVGHKTGLYYNGDDYDLKPSKSQRWMWERWELLLSKAEKLKKQHKAKLHVTVLGEAGDINNAARQSGEFWTQSYNVVTNNAIETLEPLMEIADWVHFIRGTNAHVGDGDSTIDEMIANNFDNIVRTDQGASAHHHAVFNLAGVVFDVAHHGVNKSKWGKTNMLNAARDKYVITRTSKREAVVDIVSRGHFHYGARSDPDMWPLWVQVPSFQLPYDYIYRIDPYVELPEIGATIFICKDKKFEYISETWEPKRSEVWNSQQTIF